MSDSIVAPLSWTISTSETLLNKTTLSDRQRQCIVNIADEAHALHDMVIALEGLPLQHVQQTVSYEGRSHLATIIGYSEMLLEDDEIHNELDANQRDLLSEIQANGQELLNWLNKIVE